MGAAHVNPVNISFPRKRNFYMRDKHTKQIPKHVCKFNETFMSLVDNGKPQNRTSGKKIKIKIKIDIYLYIYLCIAQRLCTRAEADFAGLLARGIDRLP